MLEDSDTELPTVRQILIDNLLTELTDAELFFTEAYFRMPLATIDLLKDIDKI